MAVQHAVVMYPSVPHVTYLKIPKTGQLLADLLLFFQYIVARVVGQSQA